MQSLLVIDNQAPPLERKRSDSCPAELLPESVFRAEGYPVIQAHRENEADERVLQADAAILHLPRSGLKGWAAFLLQRKQLPLIWWCDEAAAASSLEEGENDIPIDGILFPSTTGKELHWALRLSFKNFYERQKWYREREQLLGRIEQRKWIELAKSILCEIKNITESEAYEILRTQAMNERKRMVDVASSIVKVYRLLQDQKQKGEKSR